MQSFDSIETYAYGTSIDLVSEKEEVKCKSIIKRHKKWLTFMVLIGHIENWSQIPDHPYQILIIGASASGKQIHSSI